ncbi:MAG: hypothetical protein ACTH4Y_11590 [Microbacterium gubbeenense]|uniref:hypothetical protein n=1 Tax=Microbacterium gubbeenense TaxID=159896 RepID=UPI003F9648A9
MTSTDAQRFTIDRHGLTPHSTRKGAIIAKDTGSHSIIWPNGDMSAYVGNLAVARAEIDAEAGA